MDRNAAFNFIQGIASDLSQGAVVFPTSFDTTLKLRELLRSDRTNAADIAAVVLLDPLLASRVLQAANSAALNASGNTVSNVPAAVMRIGFNAVRTLALAVAMQQLRTYKEMARYDGMCERFIHHSRYVAAVAFVVAREHTRLSPDTAMFAGLVHDIGLFYLLYRVAGRPEFGISDAELGDLLTDWHGSIGHAVLSSLGIPEEIQTAVANHDEPRPVETIRDLGDLLYVCNEISRRVEPDSARIEWVGAPGDASLIRDLGLYLATVEANLEEIRSIMNSV